MAAINNELTIAKLIPEGVAGKTQFNATVRFMPFKVFSMGFAKRNNLS